MRNSLQVGIAVLLLAGAGPTLAEVKDASPSGFTIENTQVVPVDPMPCSGPRPPVMRSVLRR